MNIVNLFGNKSKVTEPEYYLAIEIHESLIKTALWEVVGTEPSVISYGSYESWADEESLINGVDASLEQAVKMIDSEPRKVIFGLPDSWIEDGKIHPTKIHLLGNLIKELGLSPIGMVPINSAIAHYMKKLEGIPPTAILLEIYNTKVVVSVIEKGDVSASEEAARSGDIAQDVEEGLTVIGKEKLPARFILTNGGALEEEEQRITSHPWQERLPFQNMPKVEVLPIEFSIKAVALTGGSEAVQYLSGENTSTRNEETLSSPQEESNIYVPQSPPTSINELGFSYEESEAPLSVEKSISEPLPPMISDSPEFAIVQEEDSIPVEKVSPPAPKMSFSVPKLPKIPKLSFPKFSNLKYPYLYLLIIPLIFVLGFVGYLFLGEAIVTIYFNPQKITSQIDIAISEIPVSGTPTLIATKKTISGVAREQIETTGEATVGEHATGMITIANKSTSSISVKAGAVIESENGKYSYTITDQVTIASKSADLIAGTETYGKATGVKVKAVKIGADYNLPKNSTFSVDNYSMSVAYAVSDSDFSGGTSRAVRAVSKADQDKLFQLASEKIKSDTQSSTNAQNPGFKSLILSDLKFTKKVFDKDVGEEAAILNLDLEGSLETLVYSEDSLFQLISEQLASQIPSGSEIFQGNTSINLEEPVIAGNYYQAKVNVETSLFPTIDEVKYKSFIKGKPSSSIRPIFSTIEGFDHLSVKIYPPIPLFTKLLPYSKIKFEMLAN
jgi:hypothetical protein